MNMPDTLSSTNQWFKEARPEPTHRDFNVQLGVHIEEFGEMLDEMSPQTKAASVFLLDARKAVTLLATYLKKSSNAIAVNEENRQNFLDALVDQVVTATGTANHQKMDLPGGLAEVNASNWSKFVDGKAIFDENGKIAKGPDYFKADLSKFV